MACFRQCQIHDGKQGGIFVCDNGIGQLEGCDIFGNASSGIEIRTGGNLLIQRCVIKNNREAIGVHDGGRGKVEDGDLRGNKEGAWDVEVGCQVERRGNKE